MTLVVLSVSPTAAPCPPEEVSLVDAPVEVPDAYSHRLGMPARPAVPEAYYREQNACRHGADAFPQVVKACHNEMEAHRRAASAGIPGVVVSPRVAAASLQVANVYRHAVTASLLVAAAGYLGPRCAFDRPI
jgi:hypothetical protein